MVTLEESTLQRLNRCRAVLNMHGVLTEAENRRILLRIVGNYSTECFLADEPTPAADAVDPGADSTGKLTTRV